MTHRTSPKSLTRRQLLSRSAAAGAALVVGPGFVAGMDAAWALETTALQPKTMATLIQMARDIYPHDQVGDEFYAAAVKGYDTAEAAPGVEAGVELVDGVQPPPREGIGEAACDGYRWIGE